MATRQDFWLALEELVAGSTLVIDRPRGSRHPRFPAMVYPVDYGYLRGTTSMDGGGIDIWRGGKTGAGITGVACTVDLLKRDSEIKVLVDCTDDETALICRFLNDSVHMKAVLLKRTQPSILAMSAASPLP